MFLSCDDRLQGRPVQEVEIRDFNDFILQAGMIELKVGGREFTWSNGSTCNKIDQAVVNAEWMMNMNQLEITVMQPGTSDHNPLSLELDKSAEWKEYGMEDTKGIGGKYGICSKK
ncbi:hypothetical protein H5410_037383 [Solanum commersonii]|uniref:Uncharacterized protein n=1 Tax=Solanum commersonii TaxID=4109 RepID=A0A9J5Y8B9_SOLCO|nr:hypothetical protein H5410_037383 [Solanum commersonii]